MSTLIILFALWVLFTTAMLLWLVRRVVRLEEEAFWWSSLNGKRSLRYSSRTGGYVP